MVPLRVSYQAGYRGRTRTDWITLDVHAIALNICGSVWHLAPLRVSMQSSDSVADHQVWRLGFGWVLARFSGLQRTPPVSSDYSLTRKEFTYLLSFCPSGGVPVNWGTCGATSVANSLLSNTEESTQLRCSRHGDNRSCSGGGKQVVGMNKRWDGQSWDFISPWQSASVGDLGIPTATGPKYNEAPATCTRFVID